MAYQKLQASRALAVVPSDTIGTPNVASGYKTSTATATTANKLVDSAGLFTTIGVAVGHILINSTDGTIATVTAIDSATQLSISANIMASGEAYTLYYETEKNGHVVYVGTEGSLTVVTPGGDIVTFEYIAAGQFVPVQCIQVRSTGTLAGGIVALW